MKFQISVFAALLVLVVSVTASANEFMQRGRDRGPSYGQGQGHGGHHHQDGGGWNSGYERGQLFSSPIYCYGGPLCNTMVSWRLDSGNDRTQGLVTVSVVSSPNYGERVEQIMSCGKYGNTYVPWIRPGDTYVFRLYASDSCSRIPYGRILDSLTLRR